MGHVSANNSGANDKFFLAGHGDLPSVQPNSYGHCVSSFMSCNPQFNCGPPAHGKNKAVVGRRSQGERSPLHCIRPKTCAGPLHSILPTIDMSEPMQEAVPASAQGPLGWQAGTYGASRRGPTRRSSLGWPSRCPDDHPGRREDPPRAKPPSHPGRALVLANDTPARQRAALSWSATEGRTKLQC
jgi:hypothetical protein